MIGVILGTGLEKLNLKDNDSFVFVVRFKDKLLPHQIDYEKIVDYFISKNCDSIIDFSACGSLTDKIVPGDFVLPLSVIDWTNRTYKSNHHHEMGKVFDKELSNQILATNLVKKCRPLITINGPRFSTSAESKLFKSFGCDVINMTTCPICFIAKEKGIKYVVVGMVTDFDSWKNSCVTIEEVKKVMGLNKEKVIQFIATYQK
jgi:5'-methylthioadenosine phosphorylase